MRHSELRVGCPCRYSERTADPTTHSADEIARVLLHRRTRASDNFDVTFCNNGEVRANQKLGSTVRLLILCVCVVNLSDGRIFRVAEFLANRLLQNRSLLRRQVPTCKLSWSKQFLASK